MSEAKEIEGWNEDRIITDNDLKPFRTRQPSQQRAPQRSIVLSKKEKNYVEHDFEPDLEI